MTALTISIWHADENAFGTAILYGLAATSSPAAIRECVGRGEYKRAGAIQVPDEDICIQLENAFRASQNIEDEWAEGQRSTAVGDVVVLHGGDGTPTSAFVVGPRTFDALEGFEPALFA